MPLERASDVIARLKTQHAAGKTVADWRKQIPPGSRWFPGCPGKPECTVCQGTGYVKIDLPLGHSCYGKIYLCDCAKGGPA